MSSLQRQLPEVASQNWPVPQLASEVQTQRLPLRENPGGQQEAPVQTQARAPGSNVWSGGQQESAPHVQFCRVGS